MSYYEILNLRVGNKYFEKKLSQGNKENQLRGPSKETFNFSYNIVIYLTLNIESHILSTRMCHVARFQCLKSDCILL